MASYFQDALSRADQARVASCALGGVCVVDAELVRTRYSRFLRRAVTVLLSYDPAMFSSSSSSSSSSMPHQPKRASPVLDTIESYYQRWHSETEEERAYVDADDEAQRMCAR